MGDDVAVAQTDERRPAHAIADGAPSPGRKTPAEGLGRRLEFSPAALAEPSELWHYIIFVNPVLIANPMKKLVPALTRPCQWLSRLGRLCCLTFAGLLLLTAASQAAIITVNNVDNTNFNPGVTNLVTALYALTNGDTSYTINFNITNAPATGPHYVLTPVGGYPNLTGLTNITINGYSQPGSSPNTLGILSGNNASNTVILDSSNGEAYNLAGINGYGSGDSAVLMVMGWTNVNISGLSFLGKSIDNYGANMYAIVMGGPAPTTDIHIYGCRFGLDVDNTTVKELYRNVVGFGANNDGYCWIGVAPGSANPRAEFNVFIGGYIGLEIRSAAQYDLTLRLCGNYINVYPDGLHDFNIDGLTHDDGDHIIEALFEFAGTTNSVIGTDGDGVNDAEEINIIGGVTEANDGNIWEHYGNAARNLRVCGNYWGVGVDGVTRFNNGGPDMEWLDIQKKNTFTMQIGSDFDGVSDALEANRFYWNYPFSTLYGTPPVAGPGPDANDYWAFMVGPNGAAAGPWTGYISLRGNIMVNNLLAPFTYAPSSQYQYAELAFVFYEEPFMDTSTFTTYQDLIPQLSASSTAGDIIGTCPALYTNGFTNIFIDLYVLDPEGWTNGIAFVLPELTDYATYTNGFPAGRKFLGTFVDNGPLDRNPAVGEFDFDASALGLAPGTQVTIAANYSMDPAGTHNGRVQTSNFSNPATLRVPVIITAVSFQNGVLTIKWTGGTGPFTLQRKSPLTGAWSNVQTSLTGGSTTYTDTATDAFYRIAGN